MDTEEDDPLASLTLADSSDDETAQQVETSLAKKEARDKILNQTEQDFEREKANFRVNYQWDGHLLANITQTNNENKPDGKINVNIDTNRDNLANSIWAAEQAYYNRDYALAHAIAVQIDKLQGTGNWPTMGKSDATAVEDLITRSKELMDQRTNSAS